MAEVQCFMLERLQKYQQELRRYSGGSYNCPGRYKYHNASVALGVVPSPSDEEDLEGSPGPEMAHDDPRWPQKCDHCDYLFLESDMWQYNQHRLYRDPSGNEFDLSKAPVGAMWYCDWMSWQGPDGRCLVVHTPAGDWPIDGPPSGGGAGWTRTGIPPNVTASPSIHFVGSYHGWLRNGKLTDC